MSFFFPKLKDKLHDIHQSSPTKNSPNERHGHSQLSSPKASLSPNKVIAAGLAVVLSVFGIGYGVSNIGTANAAVNYGSNMNDLVPAQTILLDQGLGYFTLDSKTMTGDYKYSEADRRLWFDGSVTGTTWKPSGSATFKWINCGTDSAGDRIDATLVVSNVQMVKCSYNDVPDPVVLRLFGEHIDAWSCSYYDDVNESSSNRINVVMDLKLSFTKTGTSTAATGQFVSQILDIDANNHIHGPWNTGYDESVKMVSGVNNVYMQNNCDIAVSENGTRFTGTGLSDTNGWDAGLVYSSGATHTLRWWGSRDCATTLFSQFRSYKIVASSGTGGSITSPGTTVVGWKGSKTYTMTPNTGYILKDIKIDGVSIGKSPNPYSFTNVNADHTIHVDWQPLGSVAITKKSADTSLSVTDRYALSGAVYKLYSNAAATTLAKDAYGNTVTLTTNASGYAKSANVLLDGTYYLKETTPSKGYRLDTTVHTVKITNGTAASIASSEPPQRGTITVQKASGAESWTKGNGCYSLAGAKYEVKRGSTVVATLTTDASGKTNTFTAPLGVYTVKETTPSTGYRLDTKTYTIDIATDNQAATVSSTETPLIDTYPLKLHKVDADAFRTGHADGAQGGTTLAGAKYSVKYYDGYYTSVLQTTPLTPKWEKTYTTDINENGQATFTVPDSDKYADGTGQTGWPLGTYVIEETEAPFGYYLDEKDPYITQITKATSDTAENNIVTGRGDNESDKHITDANALLSIDEPKRADLMIMKYGENTTNPDETPDQKPGQEGVRFEIINDNDFDVYRVDSKSWAAKGEVVYTITTDEQGYATTQDIATVAGVRNALACGNYIVHEDPTSTHPGYAPIEDAVLSVTTPERIYRWIIENKVGTPLKIIKQDAGTGKPVRGSTQFQILDEAGKLVTMELQYPAGAVISTFTTSLDGTVILPEKLMPGNYKIREVKAPDGYTLSDELVPFTVDSSTVATWSHPLEVKYGNTPSKGIITVNNIDAETEKKIVHSSSVIEVYASEDIVTQDGTVRAKKGELVYTGTTADGTFDTPELFLGKYHVVQKAAPDGYVLNTEEYNTELVFAGDKTPVVHASVDVPNAPQKGKITLTLNDAESGKPILVSGAAFEVRAAEDIVTPDGTMRHKKGEVIETIATDETGRAETSNELYIGKYEVVEIQAPHGYIIDENPIPAEVKYAGQDSTSAITAVVEHTNKPQKGNIEIVKIDAGTGLAIPVEGATFDIVAAEDIVTGDGIVHYKSGDIVCKDLATDETGHARTEEPLYLGKYTVKETKAPYGYMNDGAQGDIELVYAGQDKELCDEQTSPVLISNPAALGTVTVTKKDIKTLKPILATGVSIDIVAMEDIATPEGAVYHRKGDVVATLTTDENGTARAEGLHLGKYAAVQKTAPDGYTVNPDPVPFEVEYVDDKTPPVDKKIDILDTPIQGTIDIAKVDTDTQTPIRHDAATFEISAVEDIVTADGTVRAHAGEVVDVVETQDGTAESKALFPGKYTVKETKAPYGYIFDAGNTMEVEIPSALADDGSMPAVELSIENTMQKAAIDIEKVDRESGKPVLVPGIVFDVIASEDITTPDGESIYKQGDVVETVTTDETGHAKTSELVIGKYDIVEKAPADGYLLNEEPLHVEMEYDAEKDGNIEISVKHEGEMPRGTVEINKIDGYDEQTALEGAEFALYAKEDIVSGDAEIHAKAEDEIAHGKTDENGKLAFTGLRQGEYVLVETLAPEDYMKAEDVEVSIRYVHGETEIDGDADDGQEPDEPDNSSIEDVDSEQGAGEENSEANVHVEMTDDDNKDSDGIENEPPDSDDADDANNEDSDSNGEDRDVATSDDDEQDTIEYKDIIRWSTTIYDMPVQLRISKLDEEGNHLSGCVLVLYEAQESDDETYIATNKKITQWTTQGEPHLMSPIVPGTYILHEESAADGYDLAEDIVVEVVESADNEAVMVDKKSDVAAEIIVDEPAPADPIVELVTTGDNMPMLLVCAGMGLAGVVITVTAIKRRRK